MPEQEGTTTVEVKYSTWEALDKRKGRGDSFDDVIRKLIDQTPAKFGELQEIDQPLEYGSIEELTVNELEEVDESCAHFDVITGEQCDNDVEYRQEWRHEDGDEWSTFHYCEEHAH